MEPLKTRKIKAIQNKTAAKISMEDSRDAELAGTKERMVTITGTQTTVPKAIDCILDCLAGTEHGFEYAHKSVKYYDIGRNFGPRHFFREGWTDRQHRFLGRPQDHLPPWNRGHHGTGRYNNMLWRNSFHDNMQMNNYGYVPAERPPPRNHRSMYNGMNQINVDAGGSTGIEYMSVQLKRIAIEEKWVGAVIGKNGVTIQRIQHSCGVSVKVESREKCSGHTREIAISGPLGGVDQAQVMIQQIMEDAMSRAQRRLNRS